MSFNNELNVSIFNNVTNTIARLRQNVYNTNEFTNKFYNKIIDNLKAKSVTFYPEQFGGWGINVELYDQVTYVTDFVPLVNNILVETIQELHVDNITPITINVFDVIITGSNSLTIKI